MLSALLEVVLPVFAVAAAGYLYAGWRNLPVAAITDLIIYLTGACLVFDALSSAARFDLDTARVPLSAALLLVAALALSAAARRILPPLAALPLGAVVLPASFMNAGNMGLPLAELALGQPGLEAATLIFVTMAFLMYSVGVGLVAGGTEGLGVAFRLPLVHAAWLGLLVNQLELDVPDPVATPIRLLGRTVVPLMLLALGARLRGLVADRGQATLPWAPIALLVALRFAGGWGAAAAVNALLGNTGVVAGVVLITGVLPPAVMNFALVEKYGGDPRASAIVSATIAVGTAAAVVILPLAVASVRSP